MMWHGHGMTGFDWAVMTVGALLLWVLLVGAVVLLVRALGRRDEPSGPAEPPQADGSSSAEQLLAERFARGEIDEAEYRRRLAVLRGALTSDDQG